MTMHTSQGTPRRWRRLWGRHWQKLVALLGWLVLLIFYAVYLQSRQLGPLEALPRLIEQARTSRWLPLIYIALYTVRPLLFFSSTIFTLTGGFLFGPVWGVFYTIIAANLSASFAYSIGRFFGTDFLDVDRLGVLVQGYAQRLRRNSFLTILTMRSLFLPFDLVNYAAGLLRVPWRSFALATVVGTLPGTFTFILAGASLEEGIGGELPSLNPRLLALSLAILATTVLVSTYLRRRQRPIAPTSVAVAADAHRDRRDPDLQP